METLRVFWDCWIAAACYGLLAASTLLRLNHLPKAWTCSMVSEKAMLLFIFLGGIAGVASPFMGYFNPPALYELLSLVAMAAFSVNLTGPLWRELVPGMDRRGPRSAERPAPLPLRGVLIDAAADEGERRACSH